MKIEKIELNKIKVTLSAPDLIDMNVSVKSLTPGSPELHGFLHEVMEKIKEETGFNPYSGQVMVEATPNNDGIVLVVTRLADKPFKKRRLKSARVKEHRSPKKITYKFRTFDDVCKLFLHWDTGCFENASLYEYMENFYIIMNNSNAADISEFGESQDSIILSESFLEEHGKLHAKNDRLVSMVEGVKKL